MIIQQQQQGINKYVLGLKVHSDIFSFSSASLFC